LEKGDAIVASFSDIASGLNPNRRGLNKLFGLVQEKKVDGVGIGYQDRLARWRSPVSTLI
jgi:predicted site-specific integrase-resolvase